MNQEYYDEEMMLKEAITSQKSDQEIGMPDIEAELNKVKQLTTTTRMAPLPIKGEVVEDRWGAVWRRIAAAIILVLSISGLTWAFVYYQNHKSADVVATEQQQSVNPTSTYEQPEDSTIVKASAQLTLSYEKASLEQIAVDLSAFYHLDQPIFTNQKVARNNMMHVTFNQKATIQDAVDLLNNFSSVNVELKDNKLIIK